MDPELQAYCDSDPGFAQFVKRHGMAIPDVSKAYRRWQYDIILEKLDEERRVAEMEAQFAKIRAEGKGEGMAESRAEGKIEGRDERDFEIAMRAFASLQRGKSMADIVETLKELGIPDETIEAAKKQAVDGVDAAEG